MGFLDNILKTASKVKKIVDDIQDSAVTNTLNEKIHSEHSANVTLTIPLGIEARLCNRFFFDTDKDGNSVEIKTSMTVDNRFHQFSSGAAEIDISFAYSPEISDPEQWTEWDIGVPAICVGQEPWLNDILVAHLNGKPLPSDSSVSKVSGHQNILYKTTLKKNDSYYVAYHFHRGFDKKNFYQITASYPKNFVGKPIEKIFTDALDLIACTYTENK